MQKVNLVINGKDVEVTVKEFTPLVFTEQEFAALLAKASK